MADGKNLIDLVNERIDAMRLVQAIDYHVDKMRVIGRNIKTPCMIHGDERFATLIVDPNRRHFTCMVGDCPGREGGNLVQLYALWSKTEGIAAALGAAKLAGVELDAETIDGALGDLDREAAEAEAAGDWAGAAALLSQLAELRGDHAALDRAARALVERAKQSLADADADGARAASERATKLLGECATSMAIALMAELAGEPGADLGRRVDALLFRAEAFRKPALGATLAVLAHPLLAATEAAAVGLQQGLDAAVTARDASLAAEIFEPFAACTLTSPGDVVRAARSMANAGMDAPRGALASALERHMAAVPRVSAEQVLDLAAFVAERAESAEERLRIAEAAAALAEKDNRGEAAATFVAMAMNAGAERIGGLARLAELRAKADDAAGAARLLGEAATLATQAGDAKRARALYARLFELAPTDFEAADRFLELIESDEDLVAEEALRFAERAAEARNGARAGDFARHAAIMHRGNAETARRAAEVLFAVHADREATVLVVEACEAVETEKGVEDAAALAAWAVERHPASAALHRLLGQLRAKAGRVAQALRELAEAANLEEEAGNFADADEISREAVGLAPTNADLLQERVDFLRRHRPRSDAAFVGALEALAWRAMELGDATRARAAAEELLPLRPSWPALLDLLVAACQAGEDSDAAAGYALRLSAAYEETADGAKALAAAKKARALGGDTLPGLARLVACGRDAAEGAEWAGWAREYAAVCRKSGDLALAAETLRETIRRRLATNADYAALAETLMAAGKVDEAEAAALEGASAAFDEGQRDKGIELLRFADGCGSQSAPLLHEAGLLWIRADDPRRGAALLCKAGIALGQTKRDDDARSCLEEARRAGGLTPDAALLLAELLHRAGEKKEAMRQLRECRDKMLLDAQQKVVLAEKMAEFDPKDAKAQGELAKALAEAGRRDEAADMHLRLARAHSEKADWHEALPHAIAARDLKPDDTMVRVALAEVQSGLGNDAVALKEYSIAVDRLMRERRFEQALEIVETCLAIDPENEEMLRRSAECLSATERADEAVDSLLELAEKAEAANKPAEALGWIERAERIAASDELLERKAELLETLGRKAEAFEVRMAPMRAKTEQGLVEDAVKWLDEFVESSPDEVPVRRAAARIFEQAGIPELAGAQLLAAARTLRDDGKHEEALAAARESIRLNSRSLEAREIAAAALGELGREFEKVPLLEETATMLAEAFASDRVVEVCRDILAIDPERIGARRLLAENLARLDRREEAADALRELGERYEATGQVEESLAAMKALLDLRPDDTRARRRLIGEYSRTGEMPDVSQQYLLLAGTHERQGKLAEALEVLAQGLAKRPESADLLERRLRIALAAKDEAAAVDSSVRLARVMLAAGNPAEAAKFLDQAKAEGIKQGDWHATMAEAWRARNSPGAALREYEEAAALYELEQAFERKATTLARIVELDPQKLDARKERADLLRRMGRMEEASRERMELGNLYAQRSLFDLAEAEYRAVTETSPRDIAAWKALFDNRMKFGAESDLVADYGRFARILAETGEVNEALDWLARAIRADPRSIPAREAYIDVYLKSGEETDLVEDYLALADLLVAKGEVDRSIALYNKIMELDPQHGKARERLTETQARARGAKVPTPAVADLPTERPHETRWLRLKRRQEAKREESVDTLGDEFDSARREGTNRAVAARLLADEMDSMDEEENKGALLDVLRSYEDILQINGLNAGVRMKAAAILLQLDRKDEALDHMEKASAAFFEKSELNACIDACEQLLRLRPTDQKARNRLRQALNKRDAFKALESEILLGGDPRTSSDDTESGRFFRPRK